MLLSVVMWHLSFFSCNTWKLHAPSAHLRKRSDLFQLRTRCKYHANTLSAVWRTSHQQWANKTQSWGQEWQKVNRANKWCQMICSGRRFVSLYTPANMTPFKPPLCFGLRDTPTYWTGLNFTYMCCSLLESGASCHQLFRRGHSFTMHMSMFIPNHVATSNYLLWLLYLWPNCPVISLYLKL